MEYINGEIIALLEKYGSDTKTALKENVKLEYLCALSEQRENLLEWYDFKKEAALLQVGADFGALTGLFLRKTGQVTVLDKSEDSLDVVRTRYPEEPRLTYIRDTLTRYSRAHVQDKSKGYDYVAIIGTRKESYREELEAAKLLLVPGGTLITAVCNRFGMKYIAGADKDRYHMTKREMEHILPGGKFYYPMPDYRLPSTIYSEKYLPKIGDLTGLLPIYDYPKYLLLDVGAAFDMVCEDEQFENFANSFLVMWKKEE